jgi:hypothetical protein
MSLEDHDATAKDTVHECQHCGAQFARAEYHALHLGQEHESVLTSAEREAYEAARDDEAEALRLFRLKALAVLVAVYFGFLIVYAFTL